MVLPQTGLDAYSEELAESSATSLAFISNGALAIANEAAEYARASVTAGAAYLEAMRSATLPEEALVVQARYIQQGYETFVAGSGRLGTLYAELAAGAYKPFESLIVRSTDRTNS